ncbi:transposase [Leptospira yasudae]|uniref:transposase n=1 Tax=Leptospira yasudae TaxID=2202201 RepID=UPI001F4D4DBD|nr:transposase [Leptospira yasudae]
MGISYKAALLLKRRVQLFASEQKETFRNLIFENLKDQFNEFELPAPVKIPVGEKVQIDANGMRGGVNPGSSEKAVRKALRGKSQVNAGTLVLFSASQRANKGRRRHKHGGCTASIYMSDKLGGKQIGTLVHTIATSNGALILDSVPDQKMNTLGPLFLTNIPKTAPVFTDSAYPWLSSVYRNHRMVNHSAKSKDSRYRWARNRWSKDGVHIQYAEGNHRVIKQAFSEYGYIRPEYSQLYLNEYCFFKNLKAFGVGQLIEQSQEKRKNDVNTKEKERANSVGNLLQNPVRKSSDRPSSASLLEANFKPSVRIIQKKYSSIPYNHCSKTRRKRRTNHSSKEQTEQETS